MDTQLVRLDAPYDIICGSDGRFALHIATLIVVKEKSGKKSVSDSMCENISVASYPVVAENGNVKYGYTEKGKGKANGQVWMHTELKDCYVVCQQKEGQSVLIQDLKNIMEYYAKQNKSNLLPIIANTFRWSLSKFGCRISLPTGMDRCPMSDYEVGLEFEEDNDGNTCMAYANKGSDFYFYEYFSNAPERISYMQTNLEAVKHMAELRDSYLMIFRPDGLRSIKFKTMNEKYQWFVDKLNNHKG